jgi:predicted nucleic acid-binding protein
LLIVPQTLYEFWSFVTRSAAANGLGKSTSYAESRIADLCGMFTLLRDERAIYETWLKLVADLAIPGVKSFDARLAAAMMRHGITHLLTFNAAHFQRFTHLAILDPIQVAAQAGKP